MSFSTIKRLIIDDGPFEYYYKLNWMNVFQRLNSFYGK